MWKFSRSHIVKVVRPFAGGKRLELTTSPKIYFDLKDNLERDMRILPTGSWRRARVDLTHRAFLFDRV
jgi:hypothetical protein